MTAKPIRILIADDHEIVRKGIRTIISETPDFELVGEVENGNEALQKLKTVKVDVLLMDFDMPGKNGLDTLIELKSILPKLPVIILSVFPEDHYGMRFLKAGASGYLGKASASGQLVEAIRKVAKGGKFVSPDLADKLVNDLNKDSEKLPHEMLTDREFQVFRMLASGNKLKDIANQLCLSINTISTYRGRILEKMDMQSNSDLIHYAIKTGLIK
ncbi:MAG: DNA-binding response regulator [Nitrospinae bacterium CG11_big_fil_rev_8_21_14_0_20_45_15]|nr:MAG: DNA-binding response regulator [Nitrospinae bacterium CG11_big_fil_rev_8_21_14_0_20_45_15]